MEFSAEMIAGFLGGEIVGDPKAAVSTLAKIEEGAPGALSFLANPKYEHYIYNSRSSIVIVNKSFEPTAPVPATMIKVDDAYSCFAKLLELYAANRPQKKGISERAAIDATAALGEDAYVGEFAVIGQNVKIGKNVKIYPQVCIGDNVRIGDNVTLYYGVKIYEECVLGDNVTIHAGTVIGADGFGFAPNGKGEYSKIPQLGNVVIEDNVEIGANTCIDRATMGSTRIGTGTKLDRPQRRNRQEYRSRRTTRRRGFDAHRGQLHVRRAGRYRRTPSHCGQGTNCFAVGYCQGRDRAGRLYG